jgi:hypothetical protein
MAKSISGAKWWVTLDDEDPITLEPLSKLKYPPFELYYNEQGKDSSRRHLFDGHVLAVYVVSQAIIQLV